MAAISSTLVHARAKICSRCTGQRGSIREMPTATMANSGYTYKASPYSSHSLLVDSLPPEGHGRRVLDIGCANGYLAEILAGRGYQVVGIERPGAYGERFPDTVELV